MEGDLVPQEGKREESSSFLKKRTKKLLSYVEPTGAQEEMWVLRRQASGATQRRWTLWYKKFFVSFFQKRNTSLLRPYVSRYAFWYQARRRSLAGS
jgi:hypothetical protein